MFDEIHKEVNLLEKIDLNNKNFLGKGTFGYVYEYEITNTKIAVKVFDSQKKA